MATEICKICGEPKSEHVATESGPLTHPREARGEGQYRLLRFGITGESWPGRGDEFEWEEWEFVPV